MAKKLKFILISSFFSAILIIMLAFNISAQDDIEKLINEGQICLDKGDKKGAFKFFKRAAAIAPDYPQVHFFLGKTYFLMQNNDEAISEFNIYKWKVRPIAGSSQSAKEDYIKNLTSIGEICFNLKMYGDFKDATSDILKLDPNNENANYNMGVYYYVAKYNRPMAYQYFSKVAELSPSSQIAKKAKYAIEFMRNNPDPRMVPDFSFIDKEYR